MQRADPKSIKNALKSERYSPAESETKFIAEPNWTTAS